MDAIFKKLTKEDIPSIEADGFNGQHMVDFGYYKITLTDRPDVFCYTREFDGLTPEEIQPYLYVEESKFGDFLRIDYAAIKNDEVRYPTKIIPVEFVESMSGENTRIFKALDSEKYYMRVSSFPRESFARWLTAHKKQGRWEDGNTIRANIIFDLNGETEKVTAKNWNGCAAYSETFNEAFE